MNGPIPRSSVDERFCAARSATFLAIRRHYDQPVEKRAIEFPSPALPLSISMELVPAHKISFREKDYDWWVQATIARIRPRDLPGPANQQAFRPGSRERFQ